MGKVKMLPSLLAKALIILSFRLFTFLFKVDSNKVTFASYRDLELKGNMAYLYKELSYNYPDISVSFLFKKYRASIAGRIDYLLHMILASYHLATSRFFIIDDYYFPVYVISARKGSEVIQLWHAAGAFKKFGLSTVGKEFGPSQNYIKHIKVHSNYSRVYVSSSNIIPFYAEAFGMSETKIFPLGLPRTDFFFKEDVERSVKQKLELLFPEIIGKKIILYAPTFRGKSHNQGSYQLPLDFSIMENKLKDDFVLFVHLHPYMKMELSESGSFIYHIQSDFTIEELLIAADLLLTDYSSVIFDYSLLDKPIGFIANDIEEYKKERDFYYPLEKFIPGPLFTETQSLVSWISEGDFNLEKIRDFRNHFFDFQDGLASQRIIQHLMEKERGDF